MTSDLQFPLTAPARGGWCEVCPGVLWIRLPLPLRIDHVNVWALREQNGWTLVDTGMATAECIAAWEQLLDEALGGLPVLRVICTHRHADHVGLAGFLVRRFTCALWMTAREYDDCASAIAQAYNPPAAEVDFCRRAGWSAAALAAMPSEFGALNASISPLPSHFQPLSEGDWLQIGGVRWQVLIGQGHTAAHACLHCPQLGLFIAGDQVLPGMSSNVSVVSSEPDADAIEAWTMSLRHIRRHVPANTLVLPSHNDCFLGLHQRIDSQLERQRSRAARLLTALQRPSRAVDLFVCLFGREIADDDHRALPFATGESLANLNHLLAQGLIRREQDEQGAWWYCADPP
ncbi:MBL fold metallo-hydrolase [Halopseudomonas sp.]|uniref:MBL fold metallo-hydrolase n=1 Tax=Halopseudomonas sp. TaxID=2901191 RepID=UPI0030019D10